MLCEQASPRNSARVKPDRTHARALTARDMSAAEVSQPFGATPRRSVGRAFRALFANLTKTSLLALAAFALFACDLELVHDLSEHEANRVVAELGKKNIGSRKSLDPNSEGRFQVAVASDDISSALDALRAKGIPAKEVPGLLESMGESGLVPSRASEHARFVQGTAGELERTLYDLEGVVTARVHLALPTPDPLAIDEDTRQTTASVLVRHRGASPPVTASDLQRLIAGAVSGLKPEGVSTVFVPITADSPTADALSQLGPIAVTKSSAGSLRIVLVAAALLNVLLVAGIVLLWLRSKQQRSQDQSAG